MSESNTATRSVSPTISDEYRLSTVAPPAADDKFALRIRGESMVSGEGESFPPGCIITVDPTVEAMPGHYVIVRLQGASEAIFRLLVQQGDDTLMLSPLNPKYPSMPLPADAKIVGVVTASQIAVKGCRPSTVAELRTHWWGALTDHERAQALAAANTTDPTEAWEHWGRTCGAARKLTSDGIAVA